MYGSGFSGAAFLIACAIGPAAAFEADGYRSGMTRDEIAQRVRTAGRDAWTIGSRGSFEAIAVGRREAFEIEGMLGLCDGRVYEYHRELDFDRGYVDTLERLVKSHGQPASVQIERAPAKTPGDSQARGVRHSWRPGTDRIELAYFEMADAKPGGKDRMSMLTYAAPSSCGPGLGGR